QTQPLIDQTIESILERHYAGCDDENRAVQRLVRAHGRGSDEPIRGLMSKLHRYAQSLAEPEKWFEEQQTIFAQNNPEVWRAWLAAAVKEWREFWLPELEKFSGTPAVDLVRAALRSVPAPPTFAAFAKALAAVREADVDDNWPRGSKKKVREPLENFFEE